MTLRMCFGTALPTKFSPKMLPSARNPTSRSHIWLYVGVLSTLRISWTRIRREMRDTDTDMGEEWLSEVRRWQGRRS